MVKMKATVNKKKVPNTSRDKVTTYARNVLNGKILAGPHVRAACQRHFDDLEKAPDRGFFFDREKVKWVIGFFEEVLCLNGGKYEGKPFVLDGWQAFIVGSLFGWVDANGLRRFRFAYIETAKGSGKSPLAAGCGMYGLVADGESRAEVYAAATKKDQAMILFRDAVAMANLSPLLSSRLVKSGRGEKVWNLAYHASSSFFRPISSDDGQSGPRPHVALLDEIHEHKNGDVVEMLTAGTKSREQALIVAITNSGFNKNTVCGHYHDYSIKVAEQTVEADSHFAYVCALDEGDDPFKNEKCWYKTNPSLKKGLPGLPYLRKQVQAAKGMPSKESIVRRLNFCEWVGAENPWITADVWMRNKETFDLESLRGRDCYGGLDLSSVKDLTSLQLYFPKTQDDPFGRLVSFFWLPDFELTKRADQDRVPYDVWQREGHLLTVEGKAIKKVAVVKQFIEIVQMFNLLAVGYDRWLINEFNAALEDEGIELPMVPFGQGFKDMAPAVNEFERLLIEGEIKHNGNPCMTANAASAVISTDPAGNRKVTKEKATGRVDGIVAAVMAIGISQTHEAEEDLDSFINDPIIG